MIRGMPVVWQRAPPLSFFLGKNQVPRGEEAVAFSNLSLNRMECSRKIIQALYVLPTHPLRPEPVGIHHWVRELVREIFGLEIKFITFNSVIKTKNTDGLSKTAEFCQNFNFLNSKRDRFIKNFMFYVRKM